MKIGIGIKEKGMRPGAGWLVLLVWLAAAGLMNALLPPVGKEVVNTAPQLNDERPSVQAGALAAGEFAAAEGILASIVWHRGGGLTDTDLHGIRTFAGKLTERPAPYQTFVPPLHTAPVQAMKQGLSPDGSTIVTPLFFDKQADPDQLTEGVANAKEAASGVFGFDPFLVAVNAPGELSARVTGPVGIQVDAAAMFDRTDKPVLIGTVLLVLLLLLFIYRSPVLSCIPLAAVGLAYSVISPLLGWMAREGWITVESQGTNIMTVLLFGAGTDYCLFLISRFRQLLKNEAASGKALLGAIKGTSGAVTMSGLTVVLSLLTLLAAEYGSFRRFAVPFSVAIAVMVLASLTLVPALLAVTGRFSFWPMIPRTLAMRAERAKRRGLPVPVPEAEPRNRIGSLVVRHPRTIVLATLIALGGLSACASQIHFTYDRLSAFPEEMSSREGVALMVERFSPGAPAPVQVMVDARGAEPAVRHALAALPGVDRVSEPKIGRSKPEWTAYDVLLNVNPYSSEAMDLIPTLRQAAEDALRQNNVPAPADRVAIAGSTAEQYDTRAANESDMRLVFPLVIGLIAVLLLVYLRSAVAAVYLIGTVLLSYGAALGLGWLAIRYVLGVEAIQGSILLYAFVFLVALGEDYNIFVVSSIWQKSKRMPLRQAISEGVGETGSVITSAGLILAGTFAVLANMPIQMLMQTGIITAIGILLDTFVVRPFLVPAITLLLGKWAFWPGRRGMTSAAPDAPRLNGGG
ncbi:MAG: MMPL family transporter [Paenibacillaceae bacterium]|nr:MMPL family transporter [Paenibacillaceae bacterium]